MVGDRFEHDFDLFEVEPIVLGANAPFHINPSAIVARRGLDERNLLGDRLRA
ncbi:hypothetical protein [Microvirga massiliensis]|uniref:hypothetical protein n=1 Tax=Microvirga massiliensis TaxID=1033741 RepID=UPI0012B69298|nr:hypothetical protein [Microvirga massiliensis]